MRKELLGFQRAELFRQAHHIDPVASVGKEGMSESLISHVNRELENHELIKIKFTDYKAVRREMVTEIADACDAVVVGILGHVGILYRQSRYPERRHIRIPER